MDTLKIGPVVVTQRRSMDCGLAALANLLGMRYEDLFVEAVKLRKAGVKDGFTMYELVEIARRVGRPVKTLHWKKVQDRIDDDDFTGVLGIVWKRPGRNQARGHYVYLKNNIVLDPADNPVRPYELDQYLLEQNGKPGWGIVEA